MAKGSGALTVDDFVPPGSPEQRRERREPIRRIIDVLPCGSRKTWKFLSVELTDCSLGGLGFVASEPMQPGEQFLAKLLLRGQMRMLIYTVRHCRPAPERSFAVGAEFSGYIAAPSEEDPHEVLTQLLGGRAGEPPQP